MKMKIMALNICLLATFISYASPITPILKGATKAWDETAKVIVRQGDDSSRVAVKGGVKAAGKTTALTTKFSNALTKSATVPAKASSVSAKKILATGGAAGMVIGATGLSVAVISEASTVALIIALAIGILILWRGAIWIKHQNSKKEVIQ